MGPQAKMSHSFDQCRAQAQLDKLCAETDCSAPVPNAAFLLRHPAGLASMECGFKMGFLFRQVYECRWVPQGCASCFKIKAAPKSVAGLVALSAILETLPHHNKCGLDFYNPYSRDIYAGYVYLPDLELAREAYGPLRTAIDAQPELGPSVSVSIKRGCSEYEAHCGPSDRWSFDPAMAGFEAQARHVFQNPPSDATPLNLRKAEHLVKWIRFAYQIGDDSYLSLTGGKPLYAGSVTYSVDRL